MWMWCLCSVYKIGDQSHTQISVWCVLFWYNLNSRCKENLKSPHLAKTTVPGVSLLKDVETRGEQSYLTNCHPKAHGLGHFVWHFPQWFHELPIHLVQGTVGAQPCVFLLGPSMYCLGAGEPCVHLLDHFHGKKSQLREAQGIPHNSSLHTSVMPFVLAACLWEKGGCCLH